MDLQEIFQQLKNGDRSNFATFYEQSKRQVFYNILSLTKNYALAEDLLQDTYVHFLQNLDKIKDGTKAMGYLFTISKNLTLDYFKKNNRMGELEFEDQVPSVDSQSRLNEELLLDRIKNILNDKEFRIFVLHVLDELTFEEIRKIVNKPLGTVLWSYNNSIKKIRKEIQYEAVA